MQKISCIYPNKPIEVELLLYGVKIKDLSTFTKIVKTDPELCIKKYIAMFTLGPDGYDRETLEECFNTVEPLPPEAIFSEEFSNVEVRAAIIRYASPSVVFKAVKSHVIDSCTIHKKYPRVKIKGQYGKPDSSVINKEDIEIETIERDEYYELIEITDQRILVYLPWNARKSVFLLKMECPSSKKTYYEYIDSDDIDAKEVTYRTEIASSATILDHIFKSMWNKNRRDIKLLTRTVKEIRSLHGTGEMIKQALAWQMRKQGGKAISTIEYSQILSET